jgi:hypothetical protein
MATRPVYDQAQFARIVGAQFGVITRDQASACGFTRNMIGYRLRPEGSWTRLLPGVYMTVTGRPTEPQRAMAALLYGGPGSVITGPAAVRLYGLSCDDSGILTVLVPWICQRPSTGFACLVRTRRLPSAFRRSGPLRYAQPARAVADTVRGMSGLSDVQALVCQALQRDQCTLEDLCRELADGPVRGSGMFRQALNDAGAGIWSAPEGDLKRLIDRSKLEKPVYNPMLYTVDDDVFLGCPDAWWERAGVAAEVDSRQYHLTLQGQVKTVTKHNRMEAAGIHVLHLFPKTIRENGKSVISDLLGAIDAGGKRPRLAIRTVKMRLPSAWCHTDRPPVR